MPDKPRAPAEVRGSDGIDANAVLVFVRVVQAGSFTGAARLLGMPSSTVSDKVAQLERQLAVTLLHRTTRKLRLTEIGSEFFAQAEAGVNLLQVAAERAAQARGTPRGTLRLTAPTDLDSGVLAQAIAEYRQRCPQVVVETLLTNRYVDLIAEGFDLAIRGGHLKDSGLLARRLGSGHMVLVASADYVRGAERLQAPEALTAHRCIRFLPSDLTQAPPTWRLRSRGGRTVRVRPTFQLAADSWALVMELARAGEGVALVPEVTVRQRLRRRELVRVLPEWATSEAPVHLVYPAQRQALPKLQALLPIVEKHFHRLLAGEDP